MFPWYEVQKYHAKRKILVIGSRIRDVAALHLPLMPLLVKDTIYCTIIVLKMMKGRWESNINVWFWFMYSQKLNCGTSRYFENRIIMFCLAPKRNSDETVGHYALFRILQNLFTESENTVENQNHLLFCYRHFQIFASDFYLFCISMLLNKFWCLAPLAFYIHGLSTICWNKKKILWMSLAVWSLLEQNTSALNFICR